MRKDMLEINTDSYFSSKLVSLLSRDTSHICHFTIKRVSNREKGFEIEPLSSREFFSRNKKEFSGTIEL